MMAILGNSSFIRRLYHSYAAKRVVRAVVGDLVDLSQYNLNFEIKEVLAAVNPKRGQVERGGFITE